MELVLFLGQVIMISLSGVMAPGPVTAVAIASGARNRYAGILMAIGHGIVEFPLMIVIVLGAGTLLKSTGARIGIGLVGGAFLLLMGSQMLLSLRKDQIQSTSGMRHKPLVAGIILSGGNPYFLLWWATVGLALCTRASSLGIWAFALFALVHWLCDLIWLSFLSYASFKGSHGFGGHLQSAVLLICGTALLCFGFFFIFDAVKALF
jgi:threonine/homoserine/homoserine lactone efflux protein